MRPCRVGLVFRVSASHAVGCGFEPRPVYTKDHHINGTNCLPPWHACTVHPGCLKDWVVCGTVYGYLCWDQWLEKVIQLQITFSLTIDARIEKHACMFPLNCDYGNIF